MSAPPIQIARRAEVSRREVLRLIAGGAALAAGGCLERPGDREILPYLDDPPEARPGALVRYASATPVGGFACGVLIETREGRPIKLDGNPLHPASRGATTAAIEARVLDLYDPQRSRAPRVRGRIATWPELADELVHLAAAARGGGAVWIVVPPSSSPTMGALLARLRETLGVRVVVDAPIDHRVAYRGALRALGAPLEQQIDLARADVVIALDADPLAAMPMTPGWARAASSRREPGPGMSRWWVAEPMPTPTGTFADRRLAVRASDIAAVAAAIVAELDPSLALGSDRLDDRARAWARAAAADLRAHPSCAIVVGDRQPAAVHALARALDARSPAVSFTTPALVELDPDATLAELSAELAAGRVAGVIALDANPIATAPRALDLARVWTRAARSLHVGAYLDETAMRSRLHVPLSHELEAWGDLRAWDGTATIVQPAIAPLHESQSAIEILAALAGDVRPARAIVRDTWRALDDAAWRAALARGVIDGTAETPRPVAASLDDRSRAELRELLAPAAGGIEIDLAPSPQLGDGRAAGNAWLAELPHPITKQTWGNAALLSPATARAMSLDDGDVVALATAAGRVDLPALIVAGHADGAVTVELGWGRDAPALPIAYEVGGDGYALRADGGTLIVTGRASPTFAKRPPIRVQHTFDEHDRDVAPSFALAAFVRDPDVTRDLRGPQPTLDTPRTPPADVPQWAMTIDTGRCTACSACVIACQAENNIPVVGPSDVERGRHMHWIRVDTYERGDLRTHQPVPCQHCEDAPCEYVCPTGATDHDPGGLNEQVYNRCVGTRFCSNNCPYKVRRFNWFAYDEPVTTAALQRNPDVTVRSRGVMEKCTYCVQRIRRAEIAARLGDRAIAPGEVTTACQDACPTGAIHFGALQHADTQRARTTPRRYELLHHLGTRPRTLYLAKIRNGDDA